MRLAAAALLGVVVTLATSLALELALYAWLAAPDGAPLPLGRTFFSATLGLTFGASVLGGFVAAHVATAHRMRAALVVALAASALAVLSARDAPTFVAVALPVLALVGALGGGALRANVRGAADRTRGARRK